MRAVSAFFLIFTLAAGAKEPQRLIVGVQNINYFPHYDFSGDTDKGYFWAVMEAFAAQHEVQFIYQALPIRRLNRELDKGTVDFAYPGNPKWSANSAISKHFSEPVVTVMGGTMVRPENVGKGLDGFSSLSVPRGFSPVMWQPYLEQGQVRLVQVADIRAALEMVIRKRVSGADIEYHVAKQALSRQGQPDALVLDPGLPYDLVSFSLVTIKHPQLITAFNAFLQQNPSLIDTLHKKYEVQSPQKILAQHAPTE